MIKFLLIKDFLNSLISVLDNYIPIDTTSKYNIHVKQLKNKIMNHGRKLLHQEEEKVVIYFYENVSAILIELFAIYINTIEKISQDYFTKSKK